MMVQIEEGIKKELYNDLHSWCMKNTFKTDIAWHELKARLAEYLVEKGWFKEGGGVMAKEVGLNKNVANFEYNGTAYEIDLLTDSITDGFATYDIFSGTKCVATMYLEYDADEMASDLIMLAKIEIDRVDH